MKTALIGLVGVLIGILLTEYLRRQSRIEKYSSNVFDERLQVHDRLLRILYRSASLVRETAEDSNVDAEEAQTRVTAAALRLAKYCDSHPLFLNEEITVHCGAAFAGAHDIFESQGEERQRNLEDFNRRIRQATRMIVAESGIDELNKLFGSVTKAKHESDIIRYFRAKSREQIRKDQRIRDE